MHMIYVITMRLRKLVHLHASGVPSIDRDSKEFFWMFDTNPLIYEINILNLL